MKLSQAAAYFNAVYLEGWDGAAWVPAVAYGNFLSFDRFITERSFGQKKRMFRVGGAPPAQLAYEVVRTPDGRRYLVSSSNNDVGRDGVYGTTYLLQEARYAFQVIRDITTASASGLPGATVKTPVAAGFCDVERYSAENSREFDTVKYSSHNIFLPRSTDVTVDDQIVVGDMLYEITEVNYLLDMKEARGLKRGAAPSFSVALFTADSVTVTADSTRHTTDQAYG